jgi:hypothetical protein
MIGKRGLKNERVRRFPGPGPLLLLLTGLAAFPEPGRAQSSVPTDQIHVSVTVGRHFLVGVGYTHWIEEHHAVEFTAFPFAHPKEGFPFGLRAGYGWVPSDEVWRAKLGGNVTLLIHPGEEGGSRFIPTLGLTPGIQYDPDPDRSFRADLWISYYLKQGILVPTGLEFFYAWPG